MANYCEICREIQDPTHFQQYFPDAWPFQTRRIYENQDCFIVPGVSPQVYPYLLLFTKRHVLNIQQCNILESKSIKQGLNFLAKSPIFTNGLLFFEQANQKEKSSYCIDHAHIHVIDVSIPLARFVKHMEYKFVTIDHFFELHLERYLMVGTRVKGSTILYINENPSPTNQYFRRIIAGMKGDDCFNWRLKFNENLLMRFAEEYFEDAYNLEKSF